MSMAVVLVIKFYYFLIRTSKNKLCTSNTPIHFLTRDPGSKLWTTKAKKFLFIFIF